MGSHSVLLHVRAMIDVVVGGVSADCLVVTSLVLRESGVLAEGHCWLKGVILARVFIDMMGAWSLERSA